MTFPHILLRERDLKPLDEKYKGYVGIDEAGRGCIGGSMFFVACRLKPEATLKQISFADDSKKIQPDIREKMFNRLKELVDYEVHITSAKEIDKNSLGLSIKQALTYLKSKFPSNRIIYDGTENYGIKSIETLAKADSQISLVAAASIIAKCLKDEESNELSKLYPEFSFDKHKGYVTKQHTQEIIDYGFTEHHRKSYRVGALKNIKIKVYEIGCIIKGS